ncbi:hypothetical protein KP509_07G095200 [Ceratopteris richardii]|uniref:Uncharacterized protein n=1 Tax=Ceratopteris richardii TaxID=49495 RepID=A0A8T2UCJ4_CERRI|nr:hypothetical protein KP509_07G095200 [Ceratopteris richardii]KAH7433971.1 hypothetical protein KP509_07G095200 [Ceratopteris richardii]
MNRDVYGDNDPLSKQQQGPSSSYLAYLLFLSIGVIVVLPRLFPSSSLFSWTGGNKDEDAGDNRSSMPKRSKTSSPATFYDRSRTYDTFDRACSSLEAHVMDLQRVVHVERERTMRLESEIRVLQMSENFLKDQVHYLEKRSLMFRKEARPFSASYAPPSVDPFLWTSQFHSAGAKTAEVPNTLFQDLLRMVQVERERTLFLESEIRSLQKSEALLQSRVQVLEDQFASSCKDSSASKEWRKYE